MPYSTTSAVLPKPLAILKEGLGRPLRSGADLRGVGLGQVLADHPGELGAVLANAVRSLDRHIGQLGNRPAERPGRLRNDRFDLRQSLNDSGCSVGTLLSSCSSLSVRLHHLPKVAPWLLRFLVSSRRRRAEEIARALRSLQRSLFDAYAPLLEDAGAAAMVQRSGKLHVYESRQAFERDGLERDIQRRNGVEVRELTGEQARELEPALAPGVMNAAYFPQVAHCIDPFRLVQTLVGHFLRTGGRLVRATVKAFELGSKGPCRLVTESGVMDVETLVIAAGAWSRPLAAELGTKVPLESERGYHTMLPRPGVSVRIPIKAGGCGVVLTPMEAGLLVAQYIQILLTSRALPAGRLDVVGA